MFNTGTPKMSDEKIIGPNIDKILIVFELNNTDFKKLNGLLTIENSFLIPIYNEEYGSKNCWQKHLLENISRQNVNQNSSNNSPSNTFCLIPRLFSKVWEKQTILIRGTSGVAVFYR